MIASLPMYWRDGNADLWRAFWTVVRQDAEGLDLPDLTSPEGLPETLTDHWLRSDLVLSMTCGLPFRTVLKDRVTYVGTLGFGLSTTPGHYCSRLIMRADPAGRQGLTLAYNSADSQSGWAAAQPYLEGVTGFLATGSHADSARAVLERRADLACIDAVTWRLLKRFEPDLGALKVHGTTGETPALPLICAHGLDPEPLRRALHRAVLRFHPVEPMDMGGPLSFHVLDSAAYCAVPVPPPPPAPGGA